MRRPATIFTLTVRFVLATFFLVFCIAAAPEQRSDRIIVKPKPGVAAATLQKLHKQFGAKVRREFKRFGGVQVLTLPRGMTVAKALAHYRKLGLFEYVQPDYRRHIVATPDDP